MNKNKLENWITGLEKTITENKDIKLESHADLVKEVTIYLPELNECRRKARKLGGWGYCKECDGVHHFGDDSWADALGMYLEINHNETDCIYQSLTTFQGDKFPYKTLISRWSSVLDKVIGEYNESLKLIDLVNLEQYALTLKTISEKMKNNEGPLESSGNNTDDMVGTNGYHSALISIVARDLPELQECYDKISKQGGWEMTKDLKNTYYYSYNCWADALAMYLGFPFDEATYAHHSLRDALSNWAAKHEEIWDNIHGKDMFSLDKSGAAFGGYGERFPYLIIIDYWSGVFDRLKAELDRIEEVRLEKIRLKEEARIAVEAVLKEKAREKIKAEMKEKARLKEKAEWDEFVALEAIRLGEEDRDRRAKNRLIQIAVFVIIVMIGLSVPEFIK